MSTVRLIIKGTYQPPIDTPASISWQTIDIEHEELFAMLRGRGTVLHLKSGRVEHTTFEVVGAEAVESKSDPHVGLLICNKNPDHHSSTLHVKESSDCGLCPPSSPGKMLRYPKGGA